MMTLLDPPVLRGRACSRTARFLGVRLVLVSTLLGLLSACNDTSPGLAPPTPTPTPEPPSRPNLILILADDLDMASMSELPGIRDVMAGEGISFPNTYANHPMCSPSRASLLTGLYTHNHGMVGNSPPFGGYPLFRDRHEQSTIATHLEAAGYRNALIGKYMNAYPSTVPAMEAIPPGWHRWFAHITSFADERFYDYFVNDQGEIHFRGSSPEDYETDVLAEESERFIVDSVSEDPEQPFFLFVSLQAPHEPSTPAVRHGTSFLRSTAPRVPSFNERDVSDKPAWIQNRPLLTDRDIARLDTLQRGRLNTMLPVEELIQRLFATLERTGQTDRTYVIFTSDNSVCMGMHRLFARKTNFYEETILVPLYVRGPGIPQGLTSSAPVVLLDISATLLDLAGAGVPDSFDGRSLRPLLADGLAPPDWRRDILLETYSADLDYALRTPDWLYVELSSREMELYDMRNDPYQLDNLYRSADPALIESFAANLAARKNCLGQGCRQ
jgi:N-acetylglucosamine-6-sulfatase